MQLVNPIELSPAEVAAFQADGVIKLTGIFSQEGIDYLRGIVARDLHESDGGYYGDYGDFEKLEYDICEDDVPLREMLVSPEFRRIIAGLINKRVVFTQGIGFELTPGKTGLDWHFGLVSFSYIRPRSDAYSIWIPLDEVNTSVQRGGMEYVPESRYSARDKMILLSRAVADAVADPKAFLGKFGGESELAAHFPSSRADRYLLNEEAVELDFKPGDALVFNRRVWHRSCPLLEGEMRKRTAYVMRFVDYEAEYSRQSHRNLAAFMASLGSKNATSDYGLTFTDLADGDKLGNSRFCKVII